VPYTVTLNPSGRSVLIRYHHDFDSDTARQAASEAEALRGAAPPGGCGGVVCDARGVRNLSGLGSNYLFVWNTLPAVGATRLGRVAIVADPGDRSHDFVIAVMTGAGYLVELFADPAAATAWVEAAAKPAV
jgi:hypothetical protein